METLIISCAAARERCPDLVSCTGLTPFQNGVIKWNKEQINISILINKHARLQEQVRPSLALHE